jgi:hypothetical protein
MRILVFWTALAALCIQPLSVKAQQQRIPIVMVPEHNRCSDILELQKLNVDPERNIIKSDYLHPQRGADYLAVVGWLQGFFSARNLFDLSIDGDLTQGTKWLDWMDWTFSYCREHPTSTLFDAGIGLSNALARAYRDARHSGVSSDSHQQ